MQLLYLAIKQLLDFDFRLIKLLQCALDIFLINDVFLKMKVIN
jgi:hypothetical protein